jgi:tRNA dimethylallyltransferase
MTQNEIKFFFFFQCVPKTRAKVLVLSGPTASGKSKIAFKLAELLNGEIINADSVKVRGRKKEIRKSSNNEEVK